MGDELLIDAWTSLTFKRAIGGKEQGGTTWVAPTWVGAHARRLKAYTMLQAFIENAGRHYLTGVETPEKEEHREYGDAALIRDTVLAALLGEEQSISTEGADDFSDDVPDDASAEEKKKVAEAKPAHDFEEWCKEWAIDERLWIKLTEEERESVGLGDGVFSLGYSPEKGRPRLRVWDPGFYFPVLDDGNDDDYPSRVHIAWELPDPPPGKKLVRRITWDLRDLPEGQTVKYAWNDKPSTKACFLTDAVWTVGADQNDPDDFSGGRAEYHVDEQGEVKDRDLGIDFVPVIHIPAMVSLLNHYGRSALATTLQALDDLANADTDLQEAAATAAKPITILTGAVLDDTTDLDYRPGAAWEVGDGSATILSTADALDALLAYVDSLMSRISTNARIPESVLGRVSPSEVPSGLALALSFGPLRSMIEEMRLVRAEKHPLIFKFAHRLAIAGGMEGVPTEYHKTTIQLGAFLPQDLEGVAGLAVQLFTAKIISQETALSMMIDAGVPVEDAAEEIRRIRAQDFEGALALLDALGDESLVEEYLRRKRSAQAVQQQQQATQTASGAALPNPADLPQPANPATPPAPAPAQ